MHKTSNVTKGFTISVLFSLISLFTVAQERDSLKSQIDTNIVVKKHVKGPKVSGIIKDDATDKPLSGISIKIQEYSATITDDKGHFSISVPNYRINLTISGEGYQTKEVAIKGRKDILETLHEEPFTSIFDNAVFPNGTKPLSQSVYAASSLNTQGNWQLNSETADSYTQGRIAGLNSVRRSGTTGLGADLFLRGFTSINSTNRPLIVVDGMIYDNNSYGNSVIGGHANNPLQFIDVKDIENITVLKDAGAAIYGTKSANGVVVITTSHAKDLATKIDFAAYSGINLRPDNLPLMQDKDYRIYLADMLKSANYTDAQIQALPYMNDVVGANDYYTYHNNTNWQKQVFNQSYNQNYFLKITGGDNIARYALSMGYLDNKGVIDNTGLKQYNTRFNADLNLTQKLTGSANLSFTYFEQNLQNRGLSTITNPIYSALVKSPFLATNARDSFGATSPTFAESDIFGVSNPVALVNKSIANNENYRFFGTVSFKYAFNKKFNLNTLIGVNYDKLRERLAVPDKGVASDTLSNAVVRNSRASQVQRVYYLYNDTYLAYTQNINSIHKISTRLGFRFMDTDTEQDYALGYNSATDQLISVGTGVPALRSLGGEIGKSRWLNNYFSADYSLKDKYLLNATIAVDGSSRFGKVTKDGLSINGNKYAVMPSVGAAWLISSENFMADFNKIDLLKLRVSTGLTGNDDIGNYTARQYYVPQNLLGIQGLVRGNFSNSAIQWETVRKINAGIDASLFHERLSVSLDAYRNRTSNMITYEKTNSVSAINFAITNGGSMQTSGLDLAINGLILNKSFKWNAGITLGTYKTKITRLPFNRETGDFSQISSYAGASYITKVGQQANLFYGYKTAGVYSSGTDATSSNTYLRTSSGSLVPFGAGDVRFINTFSLGDTLQNGTKIAVIDANDMQVIGNPNPDVFGSLNNSFSWKRLTLDALFTFSIGNDIYNYTRANLESSKNFNNQTVSVINRWKAEGQVTNVPKASFGDPMGNSRFSDRWIEDGSYLRLRTLSLSYDIPLKGKSLKYSKVYVTANNLFTMTKYLGYDPEFSATSSIYTQGVDTGLEPQYKSFQLGVRIGL